jgi:hypothetical protein
MAKKGGRPKARNVPPVGRTPKAAPPAPSTQGEKPLFGFEHAHRNARGPWAFKPSSEDAAELFEFICEMAKLTWSDIERQRTGGLTNRHRKHHSQDVGSLCPEAQQDFGRAKLGERFGEDIFRFRLSGEKRLWGFRIGRIFHVIWWDPDHEVCRTEPN